MAAVGSVIRAILCLVAILEMTAVVNGSFFVSTHQKSRYVKPPSSGKRSMADSPFPLLLTKGDNLDIDGGDRTPAEVADQEKRACRLILKTIDLNIDHLMSDGDSPQLDKDDSSKPFQRAIRYVARNLDLLEKCVARIGQN